MKITKTQIVLLSIFLVALALRVLAAQNMHISTVEMTYSTIAKNIISAHKLSTVEQSPLYFYLTDLGYKLWGGITPLSTRSTNVIAGTLIVLVVFLLSKELFKNNKIALISAFFAALSNFSIINNIEMDMLCLFFTLLSLLFFIRFIKGKLFYLPLSIVMLALAVLAKPFFSVIIVPYLILGIAHYYYHPQKKAVGKKMFQLFLFSLALGLMILSPILIYNYLTYQKLGVTDVYFSQTLGIGETTHKGMEREPWGLFWVFKISREMLQETIQLDWLIFFLGILGVIWSWKKNKPENAILIFSLLTYVFYKSGDSGGSNHFVIIPLLLAVYAGYSTSYLQDLLKQKFHFKFFLPLVLLIAISINLTVMPDIIAQREDSITLQMIEYSEKNIPDNALVVIDPRIYRGIHAWVFNDKHYLDGTYFLDLVEQIQKTPAPLETIQEVPIYYVECGPGTRCGWRAEDFKRINQTGEQISLFFRERLELVQEIKALDYLKIYRGMTEMPSSIFEKIDRTHQFWFYPVGWKYPEQAVDYYEVSGGEKGLHWFGLLMLYLDIVLAVLTMIVVLRTFKKIK